MLLGCALNNWNHVCSHLLNLELAWMMFVSHLLLRSACQGITTSWLHLDSTWWCNVCAAWLPTHICGWECHAAHGCGCLGAPHGAAGFVPVAQRRFAVWRWQTLSFADSATGFLIAIHSYICFGLFWHLLLFHVAHCMFSVLIWLEKIVLMIVQAGAGPKKGRLLDNWATKLKLVAFLWALQGAGSVCHVMRLCCTMSFGCLTWFAACSKGYCVWQELMRRHGAKLVCLPLGALGADTVQLGSVQQFWFHFAFPLHHEREKYIYSFNYSL